MQITETDTTISFTFPKELPRQNPFMGEDADCGTYPFFTGLIIRRNNGLDEMGFAHTIDMDYKDKPDQVGSIAVHWDHDEESFIKKCNELNLDIQVYNFTE